ncbi:MAG: prolyl oligopeptidase family serine peptidase [Verrucomicrobiota bacterium]
MVIKWIFCAIRILVFTAAFGLVRQKCNAEDLPPVSAFFMDEEQPVFRLSPEGTRVAFLQSDHGGARLHVGATHNGRLKVAYHTKEEDGEVLTFLWISNQLLAFSSRIPGQGVQVCSLALSEAPESASTVRVLARPGEEAALHGVCTPDGGQPQVILAIPSQKFAGIQELVWVDALTSEKRAVFQNAPQLPVLACSANAQTLAGLRFDEEGRGELVVIRNGLEKSVFQTKPGDSINIAAMSQNGATVYILTNAGNGKDLLRLESINVESGECATLSEDPQKTTDLSDVLFSRTLDRVLGCRYICNRSVYQWNSKSMEKRFAVLTGLFPNKDIAIRDCSVDERYWLVGVVSDTAPEATYYFDSEMESVICLDQGRGALKDGASGKMEPVVYRARDCAEISGYLTLPGGTQREQLPLVVFPHGGPNKRTYWGYDPRGQFLASRGYAVFQPNFRGSSGFGKAFQNAGDRQWGTGVMQTDLTDGVEFLIKKGIADPKRIAIFGGSYGGYAALAGVTFTPELYSAGISLFGQTDLVSFLQEVSPVWKRFAGDLCVKIGDVSNEEDRTRLNSQSPLFGVDRIKAPVLIYHGAHDKIVQKSQADHFYQGCLRAGIKIKYLSDEDGGHGFDDPLTEQAVYLAIERFLAMHLGGKEGGRSTEVMEARLKQLAR